MRANFFKSVKILIILFLTLLAAMAAGSCSYFRKDKVATKTLNVAGSTTVLPIAQLAAEEFMKENQGVKIAVQGGGSSAGIEAALGSTVDIGTSSRELEGKEETLTDYVIAVDAIAVIINPENKVRDLSKKELKGIFTGKITNWEELGWKDAPIIVVNRDEASGTREAFSKQVLEGDDFVKKAIVLPGTGQVRSVVEKTEAAIGYISLGYVTPKVKVVKYNGVAPSEKTVLKGSYRLQRKLHLLTKSKAEGLAKKYIDFVLSKKIQQEISKAGFIPVKFD